MNGTWLSIQLNNSIIQDYEIIQADYAGALGSPEVLSLKILSNVSPSTLTSALNTAVGVKIQNQEQSWNFHLSLFKVKYLVAEELMGRHCFLLELRSPLYDLTRSRLTPVLKNVSVAQACDLLLSGRFMNKTSPGLQPYRFEGTSADIDKPLSLLKGLNESLLSFLDRILGFYGLSYFFDHEDGGMMVISDDVGKFGAGISILENTYAAGELITTPHYEQARRVQSISVNDALAAGHPRSEPEVLISGESGKKGGDYQIAYNEFNQKEALNHATLAYWAKEGEAHRNHYIGGGIVFPGMIDGTEQELLVATSFTLEFDAHEQDRVRAIPMTATTQPLAFPFKPMPILEDHSMLFHGGTISDMSGNPSESVSVSGEGHYHVLLPDFVTDNQSSSPVLDTRMVYPMQSDDHSQHFTLMNNSEGLLLYNAGILGESLLVGTGNSGGASHITNQDTAQNTYWQDASQNKTAFINEGEFDRSQSTGRHTAHILEAPSYHPDGSSSYVRMGDPVQNDSSYPSQSAESGMFMATTGHYQEEHQGGLLHLAGNAGTDSNNPIPVSRDMTQLNPVGTPDILQTSTANLHNDLKTSDTVTQTSQLTEGVLTESLVSPSLFNTWSSDNTKQIFINQQLQQTGDTTDLNVNTQNTNLTATNKNVEHIGTLRTDQFTNKTLTRNHTKNLENYQTLQKSTTQGQEQITTQNLNIQNYTRTTQTGTIAANQTNMTASSFNSNTNTTHIHSLIITGFESGNGPSELDQAHDAMIAAQDEQQAQQKKEIWSFIDDPMSLLPPSLQLNVNKQPAQTLTPNSTTVYALPNDDYKVGPIGLAWQADFGIVESVVHPQIRYLNVYDPNLKWQLPKPYFNPNGQMGMYLGARDAATNIDLGTIPGESNQQFLLLAVDDAPPDLFSTSPQVKLMIDTATDDVVNWLGDKLKHYIVTTDSESVADHVGTLAYLAQQSNRAFLTALVKNSVVKVSQTSNAKGALLFLEVEAGILKDQQYPFKEFVQSATTTWLRLVDWSEELTPIQQDAVKVAQAAEKAPAALKGVAKSWPLIEILIMGTVDKIQFNENHESVEWLMEHWINDAFKVIAIAALVFIAMRLGEDFIAEKIEKKVMSKIFTSKFFANWITNSLVAGFLSSGLEWLGKKSGIDAALANSTAAHETYQKATTAYDALSNSDMIQMIRLLMTAVQNPQTIESGLDNTNWAGTVAQDYQNQAVPSSSSIPTWTNPGGGI